MGRKMYTTRRLSQLLESTELQSAPPEGPNSGYLVIQDVEFVTYVFFGLIENHDLKNLPFPQNKELTIVHGDDREPVLMIPVLNQPLSSNRYYAIHLRGEYKGDAYTCSTEEDKVNCCFRRCAFDATPRPLDPHDIYQQFEIALCDSSRGGSFTAKSIAPDGIPSILLYVKGWSINTSIQHGEFKLDEARGLDSALRARLPQLNNVSPSEKSSQPVVVGKWYCPFVFVKEWTLRDQVKRSMYYEMTLEQRWEQIFSSQKNNVSDYNQGNSVVIDAVVEKEQVLIYGNEAAWSVGNVVDGVIWFTGYVSGGGRRKVGLRQEVVQRMKWEQERFGWVGGEERQVKISEVEEFKESWEWSELKCYVLVERFNLKRLDGTLVMAYDFKHCHQTKIKWE